MRHRVAGVRLGRDTGHRIALARNLAAGFLRQFGQPREYVITTVAKAKFVRPFVERLITLARRGAAHAAAGTPEGKRLALHARRHALSILGGKEVIVKKLFAEIAPRYANRAGGYTRIVRYPKVRLGDAGAQAILEFVKDDDAAVRGKRGKKRARASVAPETPATGTAADTASGSSN